MPDGNDCFVTRVGLPVAAYNDVTKAFIDKYKERTGKEAAKSYAMEGYDSIRLIANAIGKAGSTDPEAIISALENIKYKGALGDITFPINRANPPDAAGKADKWWHQFPNPAMTIVQYQEPQQDSTAAPVVYPDSYKSGDPVFVNQ